MRRAFFTALLALLAFDATGVADMWMPEPCAAVESSACEENCPPTCVRCACCAQPVLQVSLADDGATPDLVAGSRLSPFDLLADAEGRDITHVPKTAAL